MNSDIEKFIKGESKTSFNYFGAHKVNDGVCFRIYAPHAKNVEVYTNDKNHKMERIDFRGVFETRIKDIKEFDSYHYELLTNDDAWVNKNDPYTFYNEDNKSVYLDSDEYIFSDEKWMSKSKEIEYFNACLLKEDFKMDEQREFINFLKDNSYNYLIIKPYDEKYLYSINKMFINESSLKTFIDNLHQMNIGVLFDFDTSSFYDYDEGLNDFDGNAVYNKTEDKYKDVGHIYFDYQKNHTKSYVSSLINYYISTFHGDGLFINDSEFNKELEKEYKDKLVIYKGNENIKGCASSKYLDDILNNINNGFDHKKFVCDVSLEGTYIVYDYSKYLEKVKGGEQTKQETSRMLLALAYASNAYCISVYNKDEEYLKSLKLLANLYVSSRALYGKTKVNLLLNGKKNKYFAYEYVSKNDYVLVMINFSSLEDEKFDLGMSYYGYYKIILDTKDNISSDELFFTREKKVHNKTIALKMHLKPNQVVVYKRMRDI